MTVLEALRAELAEATAAPWRTVPCGSNAVIQGAGNTPWVCGVAAVDDADAHAIILLRNHANAMLAVVEAARVFPELLDRIQAATEPIFSNVVYRGPNWERELAALRKSLAALGALDAEETR